MFILESLIITIAVSIDAFFVALSYGTKKIKIPFLSLQIINLTSTVTLIVALFFGHFLKNILSTSACDLIAFFLLLSLGTIKLLDGFIKFLIRKSLNKKVNFKLFNLNFFLNIYANPEKADIDKSKTISKIEALSLAVILALDCLAVGLGIGLGSINILTIGICLLITGLVALYSGLHLGEKIATKAKDLSWLSGIILIGIAIFRLYG